MNSSDSFFLVLSTIGSGEVHLTSFMATLVVLTMITFLVVSFYSLRLVIDLRRKVEALGKPVASGPAAAPFVQPILQAKPIQSQEGLAISPQIYAVIAAAIHVAVVKPYRIVSATPVQSDLQELQELQAWSHAGRLNLHNHKVV